MFPQNSNTESTPQIVTVFGDRIFRKVIKIKGGHKGGVLIRRRRDTRDVYAICGQSKQAAICTPKREASVLPIP